MNSFPSIDKGYLLELIEKNYSYLIDTPIRSHAFWIITCGAVLCILLSSYILNKFIASSNRGFIPTFLGILIPLVVGLTLYSLAQIYSPLYFESAQIQRNLSFALGGISILLTLMLVTPFFLGTGFIKSFLVFSLTILLTFGTIRLTQSILTSYNMYEKASQKNKKNLELDF